MNINTPEYHGIELPELIAAWTALKNALNETRKARDSLPDTKNLNADEREEYYRLYDKLNEAESAISTAQYNISSMEYRRKGGLAGEWAWILEGCKELDTDKGE